MISHAEEGIEHMLKSNFDILDYISRALSLVKIKIEKLTINGFN